MLDTFYPLSQLVLNCLEPVGSFYMFDKNFTFPDYHLHRDIGLLFEMLNAVSIEMSEDLSAQFDHDLSANQNLETSAGNLLENVILNHEYENFCLT